MKLAIKNMVCSRCIMAVTAIFEQHQLKPTSVSLGEVNLIQTNIPTNNLQLLNNDLIKIGFEIIEDKKRRIIEIVKNIIIDVQSKKWRQHLNDA